MELRYRHDVKMKRVLIEVLDGGTIIETKHVDGVDEAAYKELVPHLVHDAQLRGIWVIYENKDKP